MSLLAWVFVGIGVWCAVSALATVAWHLFNADLSVPVECQVPAHPTAATNVLKSRRVREPFDWQREEAL